MNSDQVFCSVIMPVHNGERYLREAIISILVQSHMNFEFLIILNGSTDSSEQIINSYHDSRIRVIKEEKPSQVRAYNIGFKQAASEFIFIADQDDLSHCNRIVMQLDVMIKNKIDICGGYFNLINSDGKLIGIQKMPLVHDKIKEELLYKNFTIFNSTVCLRKSVLHTNGYFDDQFYPSADYEFYLRVIDKAKFCNISYPLTSWRIHEDQISTKQKNLTITSSQRISLDYLNKIYLNDHSSFFEHKKGLIYYYSNNLLKSLRFFLLSCCKGNFTKNNFRYLFIIIVFGVGLKIVRRYNLYYSPQFLWFKKKLDEFFL